MPWLFLGIAITGEVIATTALKASEGFTRWGYGGISVVGYAISFYFLAIVLKTIPVGIAYAIWSGLGICFISLIGYFAFNQRLDTPAVIGLGLIVAGIGVINLFSSAAPH